MTKVDLLEGILTPVLDSNEVSEIVETLENDCAPFFAEVGGLNARNFDPMFRGFANGFNATLTIKFPRTDRNPSATPDRIHKQLDQMFLQQFGWGARSEGLFVSGDSTVAEYYGDIGIVVPIGEFRYIWSPNVSDLYTDFIEQRLHDAEGMERSLRRIQEEIYRGYTEKELAKGITSRNEIMIKCLKYYVLSPHTYRSLIDF